MWYNPTLGQICIRPFTTRLYAFIRYIPESHDKQTNSKVYSIVKKEGLNIIYRNDKIVIDLSLFNDILAWYHINLNYPGQDCNYCTINAIFYTPNMEAHVRQYVNKCQVCRKSKPP
jgi:hypothetical protein